jgi:hypothetical protein
MRNIVLLMDLSNRRESVSVIAGVAAYFTPSSSTSNINVAFGGMTPPAPRSP